MEDAHALIVGIAHHQRINEPPPTVLKDAQDIHNLLIDPQHCGYLPDNVQLLLGRQATQEALRQTLTDLTERSNEDSPVFFYIRLRGKSGTK